jgi:hypothetical protein
VALYSGPGDEWALVNLGLCSRSVTVHSASPLGTVGAWFALVARPICGHNQRRMSTAVLVPATARLDKTGSRVLCGRLINGQKRCNGQLAEVVESNSQGGLSPLRTLEFDAGRNELDGVWTLSHYARKRLAAGGLSASRRDYGARREGVRDGSHLQPRSPESWPTRARCPECNLVNLITRECARAHEGDTRSAFANYREATGQLFYAVSAHPVFRDGVPQRG